MIKIIQCKNFYIVDTPKIDKYLVGDVLDLDSRTFKRENKTPLKTFNIMIRVTKVVGTRLTKDGKEIANQKSKKKTYRYTDTTLLDALKELKDEPEKLTALIQSDAEAKEKKEAQKAKDKEVAVVDAQNKTLNDVWEEFYNHKENGTDAELGIWRTTTARTYKSFYSKWVKDTALGKTPVNEVTKEQCNSLINDMKRQQKSLRTQSTVIEALKPLFDWYFEKHKINLANPVPKKKKKVFDLKNERVVAVSIPQIKKLYQVIDDYDDDLFRKVFIWLRTGRRRGEVLSLQMEHIDTIDKTFLVEAKNNKANVDMTYVLREELEDTIPNDYKAHDYLFESQRVKGQPIHSDSVTKHWNKIKEKVDGTFKLNGKRVKLKELHLHDIRHIVNGILKSAEVPQEVREKVLGHKNQSINDRYGVAYYEDIDRAYQLFIDIVYGVVPKDTKWGAA